MRTCTILLFAAASLAACKRRPTPASMETTTDQITASVAPSMTAPAPAAPGALRGTVQEKIDVDQYTYLRIASSSPDGEVWAAVPKSPVAVGATVAVVGAMWMENFKSTTLDRTWPRIAFGTLEGTATPSPRSPGAGMFAEGAANTPPGGAAGAPPGHPPRSAPADVGEVKVPKASGPNGRTISDIYTQRSQLKERSVSVRGKVVKATNGVLGKNWLHLRDGSGQGPTADLAVASAQTAGVGATVLVTGIVRLDRDLGAGYHYDVIVEDAKVQAE
jgi:hypothetical protein